jgi:PQQ-dependent dehydrogenase (s-GDH family)
MRRIFLAVGLLSFAVLWAQDSPEQVIRGTKQFSQRVVISQLENPWELTWGPDNMLWTTERTGKRISRIDPASGMHRIAVTIDEVSAPGSQDGLLGLALHPELLKGTGNDYVYAAYTYVDRSEGPDRNVPDEGNPYRYLYGKIVRFTYNEAAGILSDPVDIITGMPAGNDHNAGRLRFGPDSKLYFTIGDQGHDQLGNYCLPIESQRIPTQAEVDATDYSAYVGKSLRINLDGSIPNDNPTIDGVRSHVYTYGHRNPQGIDFAPDSTLYSAEHGPKTDDEINILKPGGNYGWPHVAGLQDNKAYEYARWAESSEGCTSIRFSDLEIHPSVPREAESAFTKPFVEPIATMFTVETGYNFRDPICKGIDYICWPTTGNSSIEYYENQGAGIPGWDKAVLVTTLKRGSLYVQDLSADGQASAGHMERYFQTENRYRDTAVSPDGKTIYIATDKGGLVEAVAGGTTRRMENPGAILAFTYESEGDGTAPTPRQVSRAPQAAPAAGSAANITGAPPQYTAAQAAAGKTAYDANCAVCHGNTLTNGTFATPLAGEYFKTQWAGKTVGAFFNKAKTMPPASPNSLPEQTYADIVAYVLEVNGFKAGGTTLAPNPEKLEQMRLR